mmetsp:Transcript_10928/g.24401  ORF Transcript_10928/g.24401 Transcript_10928/m.24401 type:complete len:275 (+) Transcript_10928:540-1364(+)
MWSITGRECQRMCCTSPGSSRTAASCANLARSTAKPGTAEAQRASPTSIPWASTGWTGSQSKKQTQVRATTESRRSATPAPFAQVIWAPSIRRYPICGLKPPGAVFSTTAGPCNPKRLDFSQTMSALPWEVALPSWPCSCPWTKARCPRAPWLTRPITRMVERGCRRSRDRDSRGTRCSWGGRGMSPPCLCGRSKSRLLRPWTAGSEGHRGAHQRRPMVLWEVLWEVRVCWEERAGTCLRRAHQRPMRDMWGMWEVPTVLWEVQGCCLGHRGAH